MGLAESFMMGIREAEGPMAGAVSSVARFLGRSSRNGFQTGEKLLTGGYGMAARNAVFGAAAGGVYGAMSDNTSVLGGALSGAALAYGGTKYGYEGAYRGAGIGTAMANARGLEGMEAAKLISNAGYRGARRQVMSDFNSVRLKANRGYGRVKSSLDM